MIVLCWIRGHRWRYAGKPYAHKICVRCWKVERRG